MASIDTRSMYVSYKGIQTVNTSRLNINSQIQLRYIVGDWRLHCWRLKSLTHAYSISLSNHLIARQSIKSDKAVGVSNCQVLVVRRKSAIGDGTTVIQFHSWRQVAAVQDVHVELNQGTIKLLKTFHSC